ncbi:hypothetical protein QAD02_013826 [Eretmocerus hayati]|uniref:Uncharacterized protein n=1 Tax=Eretmocerus hayati TaxID=131215 RepID=A0ACC2P374_9HYME|nr:hypothetical protein QAD02_013826 [Eretmocerus hayati]
MFRGADDVKSRTTFNEGSDEECVDGPAEIDGSGSGEVAEGTLGGNFADRAISGTCAGSAAASSAKSGPTGSKSPNEIGNEQSAAGVTAISARASAHCSSLESSSRCPAGSDAEDISAAGRSAGRISR